MKIKDYIFAALAIICAILLPGKIAPNYSEMAQGFLSCLFLAAAFISHGVLRYFESRDGSRD